MAFESGKYSGRACYRAVPGGDRDRREGHVRRAAMHFDTGLLWVDVEDDFNRARRRQVLARLAGWLRGQPRHVSRILVLDEVVAALGWRGEHYLGLQTIPLDTVAGTVDSRRDFDRKFRPTSNRVRPRWERLDLAQRRGVFLPPIDVYRRSEERRVGKEWRSRWGAG